jgi:16S rRNA (uracil1498-N3)-methyltransferase
LSGKRARHVREVLQATAGEQIRVGVVEGPLGTATVVEEGKEIRLKCALSDGIPPVPRVDLLWRCRGPR